VSRIQAVIFDMDGVLIDAKEWHYEALNRALAHFGESISREDHLQRFDGLPTSHKLEMLSRERGLAPSFHREINQLKQRYTLEMVNTHCRPLRCHQHALGRLGHEGYRVGVASNAVPESISAMLEKARLDHLVEFTLSNKDVSRPKPDPEIYLAAAIHAGVAPEECVVVEDSHYGIEAGVRAGAHVLRVQTVLDVTYDRIRSFIEAVESVPDLQATRNTRAA
jgi:beta-phosphoglucomutase-like phosphatase (HAD superfamily)